MENHLPPKKNKNGWYILGGMAIFIAIMAFGAISLSNVNAAANSTRSASTSSTSNTSNVATTNDSLNVAMAAVVTQACKAPGSKNESQLHTALTVTSVSGVNISATKSDGTAVTVVTNSSTTYKQENGKTITLNDLVKGETIVVEGTTNSDGSITAKEIHVETPHVVGTVTSVTGNNIVVKDQNGKSQTVVVSSSTKYVKDRNTAASLSDVTVNVQIEATGTLNSDGSLNADNVRIETNEPAHVKPAAAGKITNISGSTITIQNCDGTSVTINVSSSTTYSSFQNNQKVTIALKDLKTGDFIAVQGTVNSDKSVTATAVFVGGPHDGNHDDHGHGPDGDHHGAPGQ